MDKQSKKILNLFVRYLTILIFGFGNLYIIYKILTPATIHTLNTILSIFTTTTLTNNIIQLPSTTIEIVPACVAGSAFFLLLLLIFSTSDIKPKTRATAIATAILSLFVFNIIRILILILLTSTTLFEIAHWIFWHIISTALVVAIWFAIVRIYKIKSIPVYSDFKYLKSLIKPKRKNKKRNGK